MPIIATKVATGSLAITTALGSLVGGYAVKDDIPKTAQIASNYIEMKMERHTNEIIADTIEEAMGYHFNSKGN